MFIWFLIARSSPSLIHTNDICFSDLSTASYVIQRTPSSLSRHLAITQMCDSFELEKIKVKIKENVLIFGHILPCRNSRSTSSQQQPPSSPNTTHGSHSHPTQTCPLPSPTTKPTPQLYPHQSCLRTSATQKNFGSVWFKGVGRCFGMGKRIEKAIGKRRRNLGWWSGVMQDRLDQLLRVKLGSKRDPDATKS